MRKSKTGFMNKKAVSQDVADLIYTVLAAFIFITLLGFALELNIFSAGDKAKERVDEVNVINNEIVELRAQFEQGSPITTEQVDSQYDAAIKRAITQKLVAEISYDTGR